MPGPVTVTIVRGAKLFRVRPYRRRKTWELPLAKVVEMVVDRLIRAELTEKRKARAAARDERRKQRVTKRRRRQKKTS